MQNVSRRVNVQLDKVAGKVDKLLLRKADIPTDTLGPDKKFDSTQKKTRTLNGVTDGMGTLPRSQTTDMLHGIQLTRGRCSGLCSPFQECKDPHIKRSHSLDMCNVRGCGYR